ncbi:Diacylglycerol O-acyltransferase 1 [Porphyridium purpureum]|uniref:Diacylglycerol O-acyltransferase 1 n=1 Tax=Porphyridium purpureum TaxID=35688 RepID=A0A5J4YJS0_PORPP|nr:Diacylglycerol O-acyltransferase 1 [Porphyridium purpureum]|eukprot:POR4850..scf291_13
MQLPASRVYQNNVVLLVMCLAHFIVMPHWTVRNEKYSARTPVIRLIRFSWGARCACWNREVGSVGPGEARRVLRSGIDAERMQAIDADGTDTPALALEGAERVVEMSAASARNSGVQSLEPVVVLEKVQRRDEPAPRQDDADGSSDSGVTEEAAGVGSDQLRDESALTDAEVENTSFRVTRPSIYPVGRHLPLARHSLLEENVLSISSKNARVDVFHELKSSRYEGFFNLSLILLTFLLLYNFVRNTVQNGWQPETNPFKMFLCTALLGDLLFTFTLCVGIMLASSLAFLIVKSMLSPSSLGYIHAVRIPLYIALQLALYVVPSILVLVKEVTPLFGCFIALFTVVYSLKCHSWYATNRLLMKEYMALSSKFSPQYETTAAGDGSERHSPFTRLTSLGKKEHVSTADRTPAESKSERIGASMKGTEREVTRRAVSTASKSAENSGKKDNASGLTSAVTFPKNVTFENFCFFMYICPTLVYETTYPRTSHVRWRYVLVYVAQLLPIVLFQQVLFGQFMLPVLMHSSGSFLFDIMKIAVPSILVWLMGFYAFFHCSLNIWAELNRFADRNFYSDWWNATTLESFWNHWNVLVHEFCLRHIFVESQARYRVGRSQAAVATFVVSAILHEFIFALGFRTLRPAMFASMLAQIPFIYAMRHFALKGKRRGNWLVWFNLFIGHPVVEILYARAYFEKNTYFFRCQK